jgi:hypothetical protein
VIFLGLVDSRWTRECEDFGVGGGAEVFGVFRAGCSERSFAMPTAWP